MSDFSRLNAAEAQARRQSSDELKSIDFVHRTVDAATAPRPVGCKPASPFMQQPGVAFADETATPADSLNVSFYRGGVVRFSMGETERFLTLRETLELGSKLVAHAVACGESV